MTLIDPTVLSPEFTLSGLGWLVREGECQPIAYRHLAMGIWSRSEGLAIDTHPLGSRHLYATGVSDRFAVEKGLISRRRHFIFSLPNAYGPAYPAFVRADTRSYERWARTTDYDEGALLDLVRGELGQLSRSFSAAIEELPT